MNGKTFLAGLSIGIVVLTIVFIPLSGQQDGSYDHWMDLNDDGIIDAYDLQLLALIYGTSGKPINKTALLLELETRLNNLNASLLKFYYNTTECDSLFALLSHMHSGSDISGGTLRANQIKIGSSETSQIIYFYEDGSETGEFICWHDANDRFWVSEDIYIEGDMQIDGTITVPPTTRYYSIPASAWMPDESTQHFWRSSNEAHSRTPGPTYWFIPVNLPHGAVVTEFKAWVWDEYGVYDIYVNLFRTTHVGSTQGMASIESSGSIGDWVAHNDTSIDYATINNEDYWYSVGGSTWTPSNRDIYHRLGRVRITYNVTETLP